MTQSPSFRPPGLPPEPPLDLGGHIGTAIREGLRKASSLRPPRVSSETIVRVESDVIVDLLATGANVTIVGPAGSGGSTLALQAARHAAAVSKGRVTYVDLASASTLEEVGRRLLLCLGAPLGVVLGSREAFELTSKYISPGELVVLDNWGGEEDLARLTSNLSSSLIVTRHGARVSGTASRRQSVVRISQMAQHEAEQMLNLYFWASTLKDNDARWESLAAWAQGSPLALRVGGAFVSRRSGSWMLEASNLNANQPLARLAEIVWSEVSIAASRVLAAVVLVGWVQVSSNNVAVLTRLPLEAVRSALNELEFVGVMQKVPGAYRMQHSLMAMLNRSPHMPRVWQEQDTRAALELIRSRFGRLRRYFVEYPSIAKTDEPRGDNLIVDRRAFSTLKSDVEWADREWSAVMRALRLASDGLAFRELAQSVELVQQCGEAIGRPDNSWELDDLFYQASRSGGTSTEQRSLLANLAERYEAQGLLSDAIAARRQALRISRERRDGRDVVVDLIEVGRLATALQRPQEAIVALEEAISSARQWHLPREEGFGLLNMGEVYENLNQGDDASAAYARAINLLSSSSDPPLLATALLRLGAVHERRGRLREALQCSRQALDVLAKLDEPQLIGMAFQLEGSVLEQQHRLLEAAAAYESALNMYSSTNMPSVSLPILLRLAEVHLSLGSADKASTLFDECLHRARSLKSDELAGRALLGLAKSAFQGGDKHRALAFATRAREAFTSGGFFVYEADALMLIAQLHMDLGSPSESVLCLEQAEATLGLVPDDARLLAVRLALGMAHVRLGDFRAAIESLERSAEGARSLGDSDSERKALGALVRVYRESGDFEDAAAADRRLLAIEDS